MLKSIIFISLTLTIWLVGCQSDDVLDDYNKPVTSFSENNAPIESPQISTSSYSTLGKVFVTIITEDRNAYFDIRFNPEYGYNQEQFLKDYNSIEFYVGEDFYTMDLAFNTIEDYPRTNKSGNLYYVTEQFGTYYPLRHLGYKAQYSIINTSGNRWRFRLDKYPSGEAYVFTRFYVPIRVKITPKSNAPLVQYDLVICPGYMGAGEEFSWKILPGAPSTWK